ncbi:MAG: hypothetical protein KBT46_09740 [Ruminococcus sp.]|nr:hypothetical protein [Candidatus Copronaster equi]
MIEKRSLNFFGNKTKLFLIFFTGIILYNFIIVNNFSFFAADNITYTYHIVDFSLSLCTKLLPGAIFNFFFKNVMPWHVTLIETILLFMVFAVVSYFMAELVCSLENMKNQKAMLIFSLFLFTGPVTFSTFTLELGMLDVYWLYFSLLFFLFVSNKYLYFLIPVIFILSVSIHFSSLISYILLFSIIMLYKIAKEKNGRILLVFMLLISVVIAVILTAFFMKNESENMTYDLNGFHKFIDSRYKMNGEPYYTYYDYSFYKVPYTGNFPFDSMSEDLLIKSNGVLPDFIINIINAFWQQVHILLCSCKETPRNIFNIIYLLLLTSPLALFFNRFWINNIRESFKKNKLLSFSYFLMLIQLPVTAVLGCLCSPDFSRWFTHTYLIQFAFVIYLIFAEKEKTVKWISDYFSRFNSKLLFLYGLVYSTTLFIVYD